MCIRAFRILFFVFMLALAAIPVTGQISNLWSSADEGPYFYVEHWSDDGEVCTEEKVTQRSGTLGDPSPVENLQWHCENGIQSLTSSDESVVYTYSWEDEGTVYYSLGIEGAGNATLTLTDQSGLQATCKVTIEDILIDKEEEEIVYMGEEDAYVYLHHYLTGDDIENPNNFQISVSDESILTLDEDQSDIGWYYFRVHDYGTAIVSITNTRLNRTSKCVVRVVPEPLRLNVSRLSLTDPTPLWGGYADIYDEDLPPENLPRVYIDTDFVSNDWLGDEQSLHYFTSVEVDDPSILRIVADIGSTGESPYGSNGPLQDNRLVFLVVPVSAGETSIHVEDNFGQKADIPVTISQKAVDAYTQGIGFLASSSWSYGSDSASIYLNYDTEQDLLPAECYSIIVNGKTYPAVDDEGDIYVPDLPILDADTDYILRAAKGDLVNEQVQTVSKGNLWFLEDIPSVVWTGKALKPNAKVVAWRIDDAVKAREGTDYTLSYKANTNVGWGSVTFHGKGNYDGTETKNFKILPKGTSLTKLTPTAMGFTAKWKKQATQTSGYQITYASNKSFKNAKTVTVSGTGAISRKITGLKTVGTYYVKVRTYKNVGKTKFYSGWSGVKSVKVLPKGTTISKLVAKKKGFTVKWKKQSNQTSGYQVSYSLKKNFSSSKTVTIKGSGKITRSILKLKSKKKYFVKVRTYKTVGKTTYYSSWSKVKVVKTK